MYIKRTHHNVNGLYLKRARRRCPFQQNTLNGLLLASSVMFAKLTKCHNDIPMSPECIIFRTPTDKIKLYTAAYKKKKSAGRRRQTSVKIFALTVQFPSHFRCVYLI